jgi:coatomer subunit beta'
LPGSWKLKVGTSYFSTEERTDNHGLTDLKELALQVSTDPDHRFDLAIQLDDLDTALTIARDTPHPESESKWKAVGDRALAAWRFDLAKECFEKGNDASAMLLLLLATGDRDGLRELSASAGEHSSFYKLCFWLSNPLFLAKRGLNNIAFAALLQLGDTAACVDLLVQTDRAPEAALFARTYNPTLVISFIFNFQCLTVYPYRNAPKAVQAWRSDLKSKNRLRLANAVADPSETPELFEEGWEEALQREASAGEPVAPKPKINGDSTGKCLLTSKSILTDAMDVIETSSVYDDAESS